MRRKEKEITDDAVIREILSSNQICRIGFIYDNKPYIVPMNYGYADGSIFLHSAPAGMKIDAAKKNADVCFEISDSIEIIENSRACNFGTKYRSVIGFGKISIITETAEKIKALKIIIFQHTSQHEWDFTDGTTEKLIVLKITIEKLTGKKSGI